jgi:hypothetical protein
VLLYNERRGKYAPASRVLGIIILRLFIALNIFTIMKASEFDIFSRRTEASKYFISRQSQQNYVYFHDPFLHKAVLNFPRA